MYHSTCQRITAFLLCLALCVSLAPVQAFAEDPPTAARSEPIASVPVEQGEQPEALITAEGEIPVEEDWDEAYPYGVFAFGTTQADVGEPGAKTAEGETLLQTQLIPVYRLGGSQGRATARILYAPAITTLDGEDQVYDYAASGKRDLLIEYENPNPLAAYQVIGLPRAQREMRPASVRVVPVEDAEDAEPEGETELCLSEPVLADSFRWQILTNGRWQDIKDSDLPTLSVGWDTLWDFDKDCLSGADFRCVLEKDGALTCAVSLLGEVYEPIAEPEPVPEGLDVFADPGYSVLEMEDDYDLYEFELTFAEGETVKYIRVTALDDEVPELPEMGLFTITGCEGGEVNDLCPNLTLMISDNDPAEPSELGFAAAAITADRSKTGLRVRALRTGGKTYNVSVHYETVDGTAKAGVDYAKAEGDLAFAGSLDEIEIPIELIANDTAEDRSFEILLTEVRGGGEEELCSLGEDRITVTLTGTSPVAAADGSGQNLATLLTGADGTDVSDRVSVGDEALLGSDERLSGSYTAVMSDRETVKASLNPSVPQRSHLVTPSFSFQRDDITNYDSSSYWADWELVLGSVPNSTSTDPAEDLSNGISKDSKVTQNYAGRKVTASGDTQVTTFEKITVTQPNNPASGADPQIQELTDFTTVVKNAASDAQSTELVFPEVFQFNSNWDANATLRFGRDLQTDTDKIGNLFSGYQFVYHVSELGRKAAGSKYYLLPQVKHRQEKLLYNSSGFYTGTETQNPLTAHFNVTSETEYYYYLSSYYKTSSNSTTYTWGYPEDRNGNYWRGPAYVSSVPIAIDADGAVTEIDLSMHKDADFSAVGVGQICNSGMRTRIDVLNYSLRRREFTKTHTPTSSTDDSGIRVVVYTANDSDEVGQTGESGFTVIQDENVYQALVPNIELSYGGVSTSGNLYVGSQIKLTTSNLLDCYDIPTDGVYLTNSKNQKVGKVSAKNDGWYIDLIWDSMTEADLNEHYQLNIFVQRWQSLAVNVAPSTPRDQDGNIDASQYGSVLESFASRNPTVVYSTLRTGTNGPTASGGEYYAPNSTQLTKDSFHAITGTPGVYRATLLPNIQSVNFHQDPDDVILYNGRAYAGNETILLTQADLTVEQPIFTFYDSDYLAASSPMAVFIDHVEVYYDKDGDGVISGELNNGVFTLAEEDGETKDDFIGLVKGDYPETYFRAEKYDDGTIHQYFLKVYLTTQPRAYAAPPGASNTKAQLLPAFVTAITDETEYAALTEEQKSPRYIRANNTDDRPMYGAEATAITFIDIPLGGDVGEKRVEIEEVAIFDDAHTKIIDSESTTNGIWEPEYTGQLLVPFDNPTPIVDEHNITGGAVAIAGETPAMNADGTYAYTDAGKAAVNANLGSFSGRTTFTVGIQEQVKPTRSTRSQAGIDSLDDLKPETVTMGSVASVPVQDDIVNLGTGSDNIETSGSAPGEDVGYEEFAPDLGVELPSLQVNVLGYGTLILDGYQAGFAIGIPVFTYENTRYDSPTALSDGTVKTSEYDENHVLHETVTSKDGKTVTNTTTTPDANDPNKRVRVVETQVEDDKGNVKLIRTEREQEKIGDQWKTVHSTTTNPTPAAPSAAAPVTKTERAGEALRKGNEKLCDFASACKSGKLDELKKFRSGLTEDEGLANAKNGNYSSTKIEAAFTVQLAIMFEFNPIDNCWYFKSAGISASVSVEFTAQYRLPPFPLAYVFFKLGCSVELGLGFSCYRQAVEGEEIRSFTSGSLASLANGQSVIFPLDMSPKAVDPMSGLSADANTARGFHLDLKGKVYMEVFDNPACSGEALTSGMLSGDGSQKEVIFEPYGKVVYVRLTPKKGMAALASNLKPVIGATSKLVFDGISITPSLEVTIGAGIGIELFKIELFAHMSVAITLTLGGYMEETDDYEFYMSSFEWGLALGLHVTLLFLDYSMDVIGIGVEGAQHGTGGYFNWDISASALDGNYTLWEKTTYSAANGKPLSEEPQTPMDFNVFKDNSSITFYNANGQAMDLADSPAMPQDWYFSKSVPASGWKGGLFQGEVPQRSSQAQDVSGEYRGDLTVAMRDNASFRFNTDAAEMTVFFSGRVTVSSERLSEPAVLTSSPAKVSFNNPDEAIHTVTVKADNGTKIDRIQFPGGSATGGVTAAPVPADLSENVPRSLVHVTAPADLSATQTVFRPQEDTRAIDPTGTSDFQLSGYNTSGDAKKLVGGLTTGYSYQLVQVGNENYVVYPLYLSGKPQLVVSRLVMTGDLAQTTGLEHPLDPNSSTPYLLLDDDGLTDLDYDAAALGDTSLRVVWVSRADADEETCIVKARTLSFGGTVSAGAVEALEAEADENLRYVPGAADGSAVWAGSSGTGESANAIFRAWLLAKYEAEGLTGSMLDTLIADGSLAVPVYHWATQSRLNELYGDAAALCSAAGDRAELGKGEFVESLESCAAPGGGTWLLYSTSQIAYFDSSAEPPVTVSLGDVTAETERGIIRRLYLRALDENGFGEAKLLQTVIDFDSCTEDDLDSAKLKDGIYTGGALTRAQADPYFANLSLTRANLDGSGAETLVLFEMGGNTWLLRQEGAEGILTGSGSAVLTPLFEETTGTEAVLGSDGENLAVVYTAPVANSLSNAIYVAWWDQNLNAWGAPTVLAMRNLQIYEDAIAWEMDPADVELAYLGKLTTPGGHTGTMDRLTFSDLQLSTRAVEENGTVKQQLIVLTQGSMVALEEKTFVSNKGDGKQFDSIVPKSNANVSFYAIAFGAGEQAIGEAVLGLSNYEFTAGSRLVGDVSFRNTGTAALRGSEANPLTVRLLARKDQFVEEIAVWPLPESIASGASMDLSFYAPVLTRDLPAGTSFDLEVQEDPSYFGENAFAGGVQGLLTVESRPDLALSDCEAELTGITDDRVLLSFRATVGNNGSQRAQEVFLQFSYDSGELDENGESIYKPIDITGSSLTTSTEFIPTRAPVTQDTRNGVIQLKDNTGLTCLDPGYCRNVVGTLSVPKSCFVSLENLSGLHLRVEAYSDFDDPDLRYGVYSSDHNEYNGTDNRSELTVRHETVFTAPSHISIALGTTRTMPVSVSSTVSAPELVVTELSDGTEGWEPRMGVCYYDASRSVIVAAPNAAAEALLEAGMTPTGILRLKDAATNTIINITYKIGSMADGVNIYKDDTSFTFRDKNGALVDLSAPVSSNPAWIFLDKSVELGWAGGAAGEIPMNRDLSLANQDGAYFTFETVADTMTFYFMGELTVKSSVFGSAQTFTASPATISFNNGSGLTHTVTVTAKQGTKIDRYVAKYQVDPVPDADPEAPQILWNRSFPDAASLQSGQSVPMTCYILDSSGLQTVKFNGQALSDSTTPKLIQVDENLWYFDYTFTKNGGFSVLALDRSGQSSGSSFAVGWFNDVLSTGANAEAPGFLRGHLSFVDDSGAPVNTAQTLTAAPYLKSAYALGSGEVSSAYLFQNGVFSQSALAKSTGERWLAGWNGYYQVRVDRPDGTWARALLPLTTLDLTPPTDTLDLSGEGSPAVPYLIGSLDDWKELRRYVNAGNSTASMYFLQTADISVTASEKIGNANPFEGRYDGGGFTLTYNDPAAVKYSAPFYSARNAIFRNLHIAGTITTADKFAAGLCANPSGIILVENCRSSIVIDSSVNGDGTHSGFLGPMAAGGELTFEGCVFDGQLLGTTTTLCAGFEAYARSNVTFRDCLYAPSKQECGAQNFSRWASGIVITLENCYYAEPITGGQGKKAYTLSPGENVVIAAGEGRTWDVSGITVYSVGLGYQGVILAAAGEKLSLDIRYSGVSSSAVDVSFYAGAGVLEKKSVGYEFTMPESNAVISAAIAPYLPGLGTAESPYLIQSDQDWKTLAAYVELGAPTAGLHFLQTADFQTFTLLAEGKPFSGVYDGGGHTLSVSLTHSRYSASSYVAPFSKINGAVIENLHIAGIVSGGQHSSGLVGRSDGSGNLIRNCLIETGILINTTHGGGLIGHAGSSEITVEGCVFRGSISGGVNVGVLCGWADSGSRITLRSCLELGRNYTGQGVNPVGLGFFSERTLKNVFFTNPQKGSPSRNWTGVGTRAWRILPEEDVELRWETPEAVYDVSGIDVFSFGLQREGILYAGKDTELTVTPAWIGTEPENVESFELSTGEHIAPGNSLRMKMPEKDVTVSAVFHDWNAPKYTWAEDYSTITASVTCKNNSTHVFKETVKTNFILTKPSTFETEGSGVYTAEFTSSLFKPQRMQVVIPPVACEGGEACPSLAFTDMPPITSTMHIPIDWAVLNKITTGTSATTFGTKNSCTRAQFVTFLWRTRGQPEPTVTKHPFKDVKESAYYYKAMLWAVEEGITSGTSATTFSPNKPCTRAQVVTFLWRMEGQPEPASTENPFTDAKTSGFYYKAMLWAVGKKITTGTSDTTFSPNNNCTRAQCVTFLYREFAQ